jgi:hypothetical protein
LEVPLKIFTMVQFGQKQKSTAEVVKKQRRLYQWSTRAQGESDRRHPTPILSEGAKAAARHGRDQTTCSKLLAGSVLLLDGGCLEVGTSQSSVLRVFIGPVDKALPCPSVEWLMLAL